MSPCPTQANINIIVPITNPGIYAGGTAEKSPPPHSAAYTSRHGHTLGPVASYNLVGTLPNIVATEPSTILLNLSARLECIQRMWNHTGTVPR